MFSSKISKWVFRRVEIFKYLCWRPCRGSSSVWEGPERALVSLHPTPLPLCPHLQPWLPDYFCSAKRTWRNLRNPVAWPSIYGFWMHSARCFSFQTRLLKSPIPIPALLTPCCLLPASSTTVVKPSCLKAFVIANRISSLWSSSHCGSWQYSALIMEFCLDGSTTSASYPSSPPCFPKCDCPSSLPLMFFLPGSFNLAFGFSYHLYLPL